MLYRVPLRLLSLAMALLTAISVGWSAQNNAASPSAYEQRKLEIEQQQANSDAIKANAEKDKAKTEQDRLVMESHPGLIEWVKATAPVVGAVVGIGVPLVGLFLSIWTLNRSLQGQAIMKIGELALQGYSPVAALNRARLLAKMLGKALPPDFASTLESIKAESYGHSGVAPQVVETRTVLIKLLAEHPEVRGQILNDWLAVWPKDDWAKALKSASPLPDPPWGGSSAAGS
jgi:hypothetical protein